MGPSVAIVLPEWPPQQVSNVKERLARRAKRFHAAFERDREVWKLFLGTQDEPIHVHITLGSDSYLGPEAESALGWTPQGHIELYGFKQADDMRPTVRTLASLACDLAERLDGMIILNKDFTFVTTDVYANMAKEPSFEISGFPIH